MRKINLLQMVITITLLIMPGLLRAQADYKGCSDHPLLSRMKDFYISSCQEVEYDAHTFYDAKGKRQAIEGHKWRISYKIKKGFKPAGVLKIKKNYINSVKKIGGTILKEGSHAFMKVDQSGRETWIELNTATTTTGDNYSLIIVETAVMEQEVIADPDAMASGMDATGHITVYGIYFDHDSDAVKSESKPALEAIAEMLKTNKSLDVYVVGHTDSTGKPAYNLELSRKRAQAVVDKLIAKYGISQDRLKAEGVGSLSPISTNRTEDGKKLNRRVELVEMGSRGTGQVIMTSPVEKHATKVPDAKFSALLDAASLSYGEGSKVEAVQNLKMGVLSIWDELPLTVKNIRLVSDTTNYTSRKNNVFRKGEPIYITSQIFGHKLEKVGDGYKTSITTDFLVIENNGNVLGGQQNVLSLDHISPIPVTDFSLDLTYTLSGASEGIYNFQTTVNDKNSGKSTKFMTEIEIK